MKSSFNLSASTASGAQRSGSKSSGFCRVDVNEDEDVDVDEDVKE